jgi:hypothetical protein
MLELLNPHFAYSILSEPLNYHFIYELGEAITYVGEHKIKLANISLGTSFEMPVGEGDTIHDRKELKKIYAFLQYEFFKGYISEKIHQNATHSLFVIAAGNSANWLDGKSRSALPCDLTSSHLEKYLAYFPSNSTLSSSRYYYGHFSNILCVGSLNAKDELSSYTNIPLTTIPFVFSYGESILSSVKQGNCSGATQEFTSRYGDEPKYQDGDSTWFEEMILHQRGENSWQSDQQKEQILSIEKQKYTETKNFLASVVQNLKTHHCLRSLRSETPRSGESNEENSETLKIWSRNASRAKLSGTSMSSPAVTVYLARQVQEAMERDNLSSNDIYFHPNYTPEKIIVNLLASSPQYGGSTLIREMRKVTDIHFYEDKINLIHRLRGSVYALMSLDLKKKLK